MSTEAQVSLLPITPLSFELPGTNINCFIPLVLQRTATAEEDTSGASDFSSLMNSILYTPTVEAWALGLMLIAFVFVMLRTFTCRKSNKFFTINLPAMFIVPVLSKLLIAFYTSYTLA